MVQRRRSLEEGHKRKFLVVVDETPECDRALVYAARRAERTGGALVLLFVIDDQDFRGFLGVEQMMRQEARQAAELTLGKAAAHARSVARIDPELVVTEGTRSQEVQKLIERDLDIAILVLAAGVSSEGPGPLVTALAGRAAGSFPIPITIVPGDMSDEDLAAVA
ncbi:universal stress protein [Prosthecomicrobium sp. N25]|uniref:universal stress protein n=1 Tax=Prosthecomicrobium sp. N25 TaxID=3129254 RepID=UPI003078150D